MLKRLAYITLFAMLALKAQAQDYAPPDADLWRVMREAIAKVSMPLDAHQQVQQIMQNIEQEAARRAAAKAKEPK